jgi:hypothetical protein
VTVTVTRFMPVTIVKGRATAGPVAETFDILASVQPTGSKDLQLLPEGMRNADSVKVFTETELFSVRRSAGKLPDKFDYRGITYQVELVDDWHDLGDYFRVIAVRVDR